MVILLFTLIIVLAIWLVLVIIRIGRINKALEIIDREQHIQNKDIINLMKDDQVIKEMLLQHIDVLKYLCEQDPTLGKKVMYTGPIGEA